MGLQCCSFIHYSDDLLVTNSTEARRWIWSQIVDHHNGWCCGDNSRSHRLLHNLAFCVWRRIALWRSMWIRPWRISRVRWTRWILCTIVSHFKLEFWANSINNTHNPCAITFCTVLVLISHRPRVVCIYEIITSRYTFTTSSSVIFKNAISHPVLFIHSECSVSTEFSLYTMFLSAIRVILSLIFPENDSI